MRVNIRIIFDRQAYEGGAELIDCLKVTVCPLEEDGPFLACLDSMELQMMGIKP